MAIIYVLSLVLGIFMVSAFGEHKNITAVTGQNVTLPCRATNNNKPIIVVEWSRPNLGDEYVLQYRDEQLDAEQQHPSFKNRVELQDGQMKDGDVSVILKDVTINDTGTYECRVVQRETNRRKRADLDGDPISTIYLRVVAPPPPGPGGGGSIGLIVGLSVAALVAAVFAFLIYRKCKQSQGSSQPPDKERSSEMGPRYFHVSSEPPAADPNSVLSVNSGKEG